MPPVTKTESLFAAWSRPLSWDTTFLSETVTPALTRWAMSVSSPESETCRRQCQWLKKSLWNLKHTEGTGKKNKSPESKTYSRQWWKSLRNLKYTDPEDSGEKVSKIWNIQKTAVKVSRIWNIQKTVVKKSPESETCRRFWILLHMLDKRGALKTLQLQDL